MKRYLLVQDRVGIDELLEAIVDKIPPLLEKDGPCRHR